MSALFGFFDPYGQLQQREVAARMARALVRPPDAEMLLESGGCGCLGVVYAGGSRREAWLHVEADAVLRGQLGRLVRRDDPEAVDSHRDEISGALLQELRGHFALARLDPGQRKLTLASDHFGSRPLYVCRHEGAFFFASQLKAILAALDKRWSLNPEAVASMLSFGEMLGNRTLIEGIQTLPAATVLTVGASGSSTNAYWQYRYQVNERIDWGDAVEATGQALNQAVGRALVHARNPAVPLSGGLDSRFVLELAGKSSQPAAYTWGLPGCRDIEFAKMVAARLGARHQIWFFDPGYLAEWGEKGCWYSEGQTPATNFHVLPFTDRLAEQGHDVLLDGFAGDGLLGGNFINDAWLDSADFGQSADTMWHWRRRAFCAGRERPRLPEMEAATREIFIAQYLGYPGSTPMDKTMAFLLDNRVRRTTMCGSEIFRTRLPVWQPFTDVDVLRAFCRVPHRWRKRHRFYLAVFKAYAARSASIPYQRTLLPAGVPYGLTWLSLAAHRAYEELSLRLGLQRPFAGKLPSDFPAWFRGALRGYVKDILASERCLERGVIPADAARQVLAEHFSGQFNNATQIGAMLSLELFCRLFLDDFQDSVGRFCAPPAQTPTELAWA